MTQHRRESPSTESGLKAWFCEKPKEGEGFELKAGEKEQEKRSYVFWFGLDNC